MAPTKGMQSLNVSSMVVGAFCIDENFLNSAASTQEQSSSVEKTARASISLEQGDQPNLVCVWPDAKVEIPTVSISRTSVLSTKDVDRTIIRLHFDIAPEVVISLTSASQHQSATMPPALCSELMRGTVYEVLLEHSREEVRMSLGPLLQQSACDRVATPLGSRTASRSPRPIQVCRPGTSYRGLEGLGRSAGAGRSREQTPVFPERTLTRSRAASRSPRPIQACRPGTSFLGLEGLGRSAAALSH